MSTNIKALDNKVVKVAGLPITIKVIPHNLAFAKGIFGQFTPMEQSIILDSNMCTKELVVDTLIHEIGHAIFWAYNIQDDDKEERIVTVLATAWTQVFKDNKWLLTYIERGLHGKPPATKSN